MNKREILSLVALRGLRLPRVTLVRLQESGIHSVPTVSVEHQHSKQSYVIRGQESGGSVADLGAYCGFASEDGSRLSWLQRVDSLGVNGVHARVVATSLVRIQVVRVLHTYDLLITKHALVETANHRKPTLASSILFYGRQGTLELDLWGKDQAYRGTVAPVFYSRAGEATKPPRQYEDSVLRAVAGVTCCGCNHQHLLIPPLAPISPVREGSDTSSQSEDGCDTAQGSTVLM